MGTGRRLATLTTAAGMAIVWAAGSAIAHVTVIAPGVRAGDSDAAITFRVPDESDSASTIGLKVQLPTATPLAGVLVAPQMGWTAKITRTTLAKPIHTDDGDISQVVSEIDWTADAGAGIRPGYFGQFTIIAGKLPDNATTLTFKAIQQYSDHKEVAWIDVPATGSTAEPEYPAPILQLPAQPGATTPSRTKGVTTGVNPHNADAASSAAATTGIVLGVAGLVLAAAALAVALSKRRGAAVNS